MDKLAAMATFVKVIETGSFTKAADVLDLPKARVSQRVVDLERDLGVRLLNRTTRSLKLTEDGAAYFEKCLLLLQLLEELEGAIKGDARQPRGRLRVEALASVARWLIAPRLADFRARHPHIELRLGSSDRISHLLEDGIDCAIRGGDMDDSSLVARRLGGVKLGLYAAPGFLRSIGPLRRPEDLQTLHRLSWFGGRKRSPLTWTLMSGHRTVELDSGEGTHFDDPEVALAACIGGGGVCPGAPFAVAQAVRLGELVPVLEQWNFPERAVHVVYPSARHLSARVRCFIDWLETELNQSGALRLSPRDLAAARRGS
jgi:LysR family transcriptional regulator, regulator for bpeEF and oprC